MGITTEKSEPEFKELTTKTSPPWALATDLTRLYPRPVPVFDLFLLGSHL